MVTRVEERGLKGQQKGGLRTLDHDGAGAWSIASHVGPSGDEPVAGGRLGCWDQWTEDGKAEMIKKLR
jgi:hypothetical protein